MRKIDSDLVSLLAKEPRKAIAINSTFIADVLTDHGVRAVEEQRFSGYESVVACLGKNQILKMSSDAATANKQLDYDTFPEVLRPLKILKKSDPRIEVYPLVKVCHNWDEVPVKQFKQLTKSLYEKDMLFFDAKPENMGLLSDGTLIIIDQGALISIDMLDDACPGRSQPATYGRTFYDRSGYHIHEIKLFSDLEEVDYQKSQISHVRNLGLEYGKIVDAITGNDIKVLTSIFKGNHLVSEIQTYGFDRDAAHKTLLRATDIYHDQHQDWATCVRSAAQEIDRQRLK